MKISGHLDLCSPSLIEGWIYCEAWGEEKIRLQLYVGSDLLGECAADLFRQDLLDAGFGNGKCGFSFTVPADRGIGNFSGTKLRILDSVVYLLPDQATRIAENVTGAQTAEFGEADAPKPRTTTIHNLVAADTGDQAEILARRGGSFFGSLNANARIATDLSRD